MHTDEDVTELEYIFQGGDLAAGGVCVPAQPNQCADYCSAVA